MRDHVLRCSFVSSSNHFGDVEEYEGDFDELAAMLMTDAATIAGVWMVGTRGIGEPGRRALVTTG